MSFELECGFVGNKERETALNYLKDMYKTSIFVEQLHSGKIRGQFFDDEEDLLDDTTTIFTKTSLDEYLVEEIEESAMDYILEFNLNIDPSSLNNDESVEKALAEVKNFYNLHPEQKSELYVALEELKEGETLYYLCDPSGIERFSTEKGSLIAEVILDGQSHNVFSSIEEAVDCIKTQGYYSEELVVWLYNHMSRRDKEKYGPEED